MDVIRCSFAVDVASGVVRILLDVVIAIDGAVRIVIWALDDTNVDPIGAGAAMRLLFLIFFDTICIVFRLQLFLLFSVCFALATKMLVLFPLWPHFSVVEYSKIYSK